MLSHVLSAALWGVEARLVHVEVDAAPGLPCFNVVGLPDTAVRESRDRVKSAVANSGFEFPLNRRLTANLAPAHLRKEGPGFDLPLALGLLAAVGAVPAGALEGRLFAGELSLDGSLRPIRGALGMALEARRKGLRWVALPTANAHEAAGIEGLSVAPLESLAGAVAWLSGGALPGNAAPTLVGPPARPAAVDFRDIKGQEAAKRALEVAAAGGHNILLVGPPGSGKTLLARGLAGILPEPREDEALEIALVRSSSGEGASGAHGAGRPFRDPHQTVSAAGLAGGGAVPRPGEVTRAHGGVLFLDELPEFRRDALEALRQPLEDGAVALTRARASVLLPARCMVAAAMNPCPCGHEGDPGKECVCTPAQVTRYRGRVSGPLLDRLDLRVRVPALDFRTLTSGPAGEDSEKVRARVEAARARQARRFGATGPSCNARMDPAMLRRHCALDQAGMDLMRAAMERLGLSARGFDRVLKVSRTIADLEAEERIASRHLAEAIQYRGFEAG